MCPRNEAYLDNSATVAINRLTEEVGTQMIFCFVMSPPTYNPEEIMAALDRCEYAFVLENAMPDALAGNPDAQCQIASMYECGFGVPRDFLEAERRLLKATKQNSALAWHNLGTLYAVKHPGLEDRWSDARKCWERAAELGFDCGEPYPPP